MANINIKYKGLTGLLNDLTIDDGQTMAQLRSAIIADEGLDSAYYGRVSIHKNGLVKDSTDFSATTLLNAGIDAGDVIIVSTQRQATKQAQQVMSLDLAQAKRSIPGQPYTRTPDTYDISSLPTRYVNNTVTDNTSDGDNLIQGRPWIAYDAGLYLQPYSGYFADDVSFFATASTTGTASTPSTFVTASIATTTSYQYLGYFRPQTSGSYTFYISSDDAGYLWVGANALSGFTTGNAIASNPGEHGTLEDSGNITLVAGQLYGFRVQVGNNSGPGEVTISFAGPSIAKTTTFTGLVFHNPSTNGI
jgi:hypothetical protein